MDQTKRFADRGAVVTGGAGGIGRQTCRALVSEGCRVAVVDLDGSAIEATVNELNAIRPRSAVGAACDVREYEQVQRAMAHVRAELKSVDVLITLAGGSFGVSREIAGTSSDDFDLVSGVNIKGTFLAMQALLPVMAAGSAIVTVASLAARQPSSMAGPAYAAAKAAILGLTRSAAAEVGPRGIRVNAIAPGLVLTERLERLYDGMPTGEQESILSAIPLRRLPRLQELIEPILFLASEQSSYITGTALDVNGGRFMAP